MALAVLDNLTLTLGGRTLFDGLCASLEEGDRVALIGRNGTGKSTLLRLLAGKRHPEAGQVVLGRGVRVGYLEQDLGEVPEEGVLPWLLQQAPERRAVEAAIAVTVGGLEASGDDAERAMALAETLADLHERLTTLDQEFGEHKAAAILEGLGFCESEFNQRLTAFSGGWRMRAHLAALLFSKPDVLLLDEPTNHLDLPAVAWFSAFLRRYRGAFVLISHDRELLDEQCAQVWSLGPLGFEAYKGSLERYVSTLGEREEQQVRQAHKLADERERMERFIAKFRAQANRAAAVQSRVKMLEKMDKPELPQAREQSLRFRFPKAPASGRDVLQAEGLTKVYGNKTVLAGVEVQALRGERIAVVGKNGAGKSTLLRVLAGDVTAEAGKVELGHKVEMGFFAQHALERLNAKAGVLEEALGREPIGGEAPARAALGALGLGAAHIDKRVEVLSGGERARLALAKILLKPANLLLLDEPTNHLDLDAVEALAEALDAFQGTLLFVSHHRTLIRRLAQRIWVVDEGQVTEHLYGFDALMRRLESDERGGGNAGARSAGAHTDAAVRKSAKRRGGSQNDGKQGGGKQTAVQTAATDAKQTAAAQSGAAGTGKAASGAKVGNGAAGKSGGERSRKRKQNEAAIRRGTQSARRQVQALEQRIAELEAEQHALNAMLAEGVNGDADALARKLAYVAAELQRSETQWAEQSEALEHQERRLREELGGLG